MVIPVQDVRGQGPVLTPAEDSEELMGGRNRVNDVMQRVTI